MKVTQSCPTLCNPEDDTVHGILQARILESIPFPFSRGSSQPRDRTQVVYMQVNPALIISETLRQQVPVIAPLSAESFAALSFTHDLIQL